MRAALNQMARRQQAPGASSQNRNHRSSCEGFDYISRMPARKLLEEDELLVDFSFPSPSRSPVSPHTQALHMDGVLSGPDALLHAAVGAARSVRRAEPPSGIIGALIASPAARWPTLAQALLCSGCEAVPRLRRNRDRIGSTCR